jgi:hypothetical protein
MRTFARVVAGVAAIVFLSLGVWALAAPESFATKIANYGVYNEHLTHDLGAFQIGLGVAALAGLLLTDALAAVLAGVAAGALAHGLAHIIDHGLGGRSSDPWTISLLGLVLLGAFLAAVRSRAGRPARAARPAREPVRPGPRL